MERLFNVECNPNSISPLTLAFVGDSVFDLMVRETLVAQANRPVRELNKLKVQTVCCKNQAVIVKNLLPVLTEGEVSVYKRGRNAHCGHTPKNASKADYHEATGFEALFGYIYLSGNIKRLRELFNIILESFRGNIDE